MPHAFIRASHEKKNSIDLFLARWEYRMEFCDSLPPSLQRYDFPPGARNDRRYDAFLNAMAQFNGGKEDSTTIATYTSLDRRGLEKSHILDFFLSHAQRSVYGM